MTEIQERNRRPGRIPAAGPATNETYQRRVDEVVALLREARVLPVATIENPAQVEGVCRALAAGGIGCIEIAFRTAAAARHCVRARAVEGFLLGAGTVLTVRAGAGGRRSRRRLRRRTRPERGDRRRVPVTCGLPFFPGVATPSEIDRARRLGLSTLKVFPAAELGGPGIPARRLGRLSRTSGFIPTGGHRRRARSAATSPSRRRRLRRELARQAAIW